jgi:hypothetical protein
MISSLKNGDQVPFMDFARNAVGGFVLEDRMVIDQLGGSEKIAALQQSGGLLDALMELWKKAVVDHIPLPELPHHPQHHRDEALRAGRYFRV